MTLEPCFREILTVDFEYVSKDGERPVPVCVVAHELVSGRHHRMMLTENPPAKPPYPTDDAVLFVAYYASAELGCHLELGWEIPLHVLDLYVEFRNSTNGLEVPSGRSLLGALTCHGLDGIGAVEKDSMRQLAMRGAPYTIEETEALLNYCESDVAALDKLLHAMLPKLDLPRAVYRGRFMRAAAHIERTGVPIDVEALTAFRENWGEIQSNLIRRVDSAYSVYEGRTFKRHRFASYLDSHNIDWPQLDSGELALDDDTFRQMAKLHPEIEPLRQLRSTLSQMRLGDLAVGSDSRNRCVLSAFSAKTGRNQPSNSRSIFGPAAWIRGLVKPQPGYGIAYVDYAQQEFGIAGALSGDKAMMDAYSSGDPYLSFAKQVGGVPPDATKSSHEAERELFKRCALAVQYRMGQDSLASQIGQSAARASDLLQSHRKTYPRYWEWSEEVMDHAKLRLELPTVFGWTLRLTDRVKSRTIYNFPMQANGSEMLRLACCLATERGVKVCLAVHDALLVEAPVGSLDAAVVTTQEAMHEASRIVLNGFELRTEEKVVAYPERYEDKKGAAMWNLVWDEVGKISEKT